MRHTFFIIIMFCLVAMHFITQIMAYNFEECKVIKIYVYLYFTEYKNEIKNIIIYCAKGFIYLFFRCTYYETMNK